MHQDWDAFDISIRKLVAEECGYESTSAQFNQESVWPTPPVKERVPDVAEGDSVHRLRVLAGGPAVGPAAGEPPAGAEELFEELKEKGYLKLKRWMIAQGYDPESVDRCDGKESLLRLWTKTRVP